MSTVAPAAVPTRRAPARGSRALLLALGLLAAGALLVLAVGLSVAVGARSVPLGDVWSALLHPDGSYTSTVVASRVPRTQLGVLVGAALAVAGVVIQGLTRNPLGDPGLLGVNAGASASVVLTISLLGPAAGRSVWAAIPGALVAAVAVYLVGSGGRRATPVRLVLAGAAVSAVLVALVEAVSLTQPLVFDSYRVWVVGSLAGRPPELVGRILPFVLAGLVLCALLARPLNALALGDESATSLGLHAGRTRLLGGAAATVLCAAAVAAVGPIAFVGLAVPHVVRSFTGSDHRWLLPYCALLGPVLLLASDVVGRVVARPGELMVGAVTAFVGAPFLVAAVRRGRVAL
ncbi:FecCD family ABC transporter permease [Cellulomonas fimi]|uniref:Transport system permease protein n=1 Tax=Cellulomonas fimi (strain ATCC 484 / DSM 20113 / JCM 1341 / CCUG 24087 / LMG 16345 / NBRC 15513 / NCIMB 8980 / NCTC 7547 / NRS-133) TaxID=590998 RepID=F4H0H3_CELFA|nr:iron ABC transporter permease [Cellulomonas fimi]AEE47342.1 transport system permease protein [Cellulomonas fimi ATCC 484]NNH05828.1 iron ABC transporter permease [Cellulomonas fimi]VEH35982.1 Ferric enterobactin transport system permease protein fepD [Cellulomonas fimi]